MSDDPHTYPGDVHRDGPIRRRSEQDVERELSVDHQDDDTKPGGAEGGDQSPSADVAAGAPADDQAAMGSTDQHSDAANANQDLSGDSDK